MTFWTGARVAQVLGVPDPGRAFAGVSTDTRALKGGELFVALRGDRFDAHAFLEEARDRGAAAAVVRRGTPAVANLPLLEVPDTLAALGALGRGRRRALPPDAPVIAITGSSGKTTTKELTRAALGARWRVHATTGNLNNLVGVPLTLLATPDDAQALVIEAGASVPGEIAALRDVIEPTIAVVTNVGYAHVEGFGSLEAVLAEKVSLCAGAPLAVVGTEPPALATEARRRARRVIVAGHDPRADVRPDTARLTEQGQPEIGWRGAQVVIPVLGLHQVNNAMIAVAAAVEAGVPPADALRALAGARLPPGRGGIQQIGDLTVIDDTYNANPGSLRAAVELARWLAERRGRRLVLVVGSMLELGSESDKLHAAAAREILAARPALVGAVGAFVPAFEALGQGLPLITAADAEALGPALRAALRGDEVVLLKASRGVALERVLRHLHHAGAN
jgi:UDP-N-acetylmuramoyl-tripeptide--D-alanyl-D-alanine ligase